MNNEPVAWMVERTTGTKGYGDTPYVTLLDATKSTYWIENKIPEGYTVIPLYTHPVKELTDEEIHNLMDEIEILVHGDIKRAMYRMARKVESILNE